MRKISLLLTLAMMTCMGVKAQMHVGGTTAPQSSAILQATSTTKGFLPPRLTTAQRDAIPGAGNGLVIYNIDVPCLQVYDSLNAKWGCTSTGTGQGAGVLGSNDPNDPSAACTPSSVHGVYTQGVGTTAGNYITVTVTATSLGAYTIATPVVSGIKFANTGVFTTLGSQTVNLYAQGTPSANGTIQVPVVYGSQSCTVDIPVQDPPASVATGTLSCAGALAGTYQLGVAMTAANTKTIVVTPSTAGSYSFSTSVVNGISFAAASNFTPAQVGSPVNIVMQANGTPTSSGNPSFLVNGMGQSCGFTVPISSNQYYMFAKPAAGQQLGATATDINFTSTINSNVSVAGNSITLKAGHRYRLRAGISVNYMSSATAGYFRFTFVNSSNVALAGSAFGTSEANQYNNGNGHWQEEAVAVVNVTGTDMTVKLRRTDGNGTGDVVPTESYVIVEEIPAGSDFLMATVSTAQPVNATPSDVGMTASSNNGVTVSGSTITLLAGKTYRLSAALRIGSMNSATTASFKYSFVNNANVVLPNANATTATSSAYNNNTYFGNDQANAVVTVGATDMVVKLRVTEYNAGSTGSIDAAGTYIFVEEIPAADHHAFAIPSGQPLGAAATYVNYTQLAANQAQASGDGILLKAGHTYSLSASTSFVNGSNNAAFDFSFVDPTGAALSNSAIGGSRTNLYANPQHKQSKAVAIFAPLVDTIVKLKSVGINGASTATADNEGFLIVREIK